MLLQTQHWRKESVEWNEKHTDDEGGSLHPHFYGQSDWNVSNERQFVPFMWVTAQRSLDSFVCSQKALHIHTSLFVAQSCDLVHVIPRPPPAFWIFKLASLIKLTTQTNFLLVEHTIWARQKLSYGGTWLIWTPRSHDHNEGRHHLQIRIKCHLHQMESVRFEYSRDIYFQYSIQLDCLREMHRPPPAQLGKTNWLQLFNTHTSILKNFKWRSLSSFLLPMHLPYICGI